MEPMNNAEVLVGQDRRFVSMGECANFLRRGAAYPTHVLQLRMRPLGHKIFQVPTRGYHGFLTFHRHHCFQSYDHYPDQNFSPCHHRPSVKGCGTTPRFGVGNLSHV